MRNRHVSPFVLFRSWVPVICLAVASSVLGDAVDDDIRQIDLRRGVVALVNVHENDPNYLIDLVKRTEWTVFVQTENREAADALREAASKQELLSQRMFIAVGGNSEIQLGDNVADRLLASDSTPRAEQMRVLRPRGVALTGDQMIRKPVPTGADDWSHPYHGADNNPQSDDQLVRGDLRTQFIGYPKFSPMPEQTVIAGGRIYKAMGHIAHKANQNVMLNTLLCINAYNGTILWNRPLSKGFMLHRNTMIATDDALYLGDHESCKIIDGETGKLVDELKVDAKISDGPVWKWMAMRDGVLYALVGNPEVKIETQRAIRRGLGHWPWGMWDGHDYDDPRTSFGFGRTLVAIDLRTKERIWHHRSDEFLDARAVCMNDGQIFSYCPGKFLLSIDRYTGKPTWENRDQDLLNAIDDNQKAQHYITGYATTCYMKCSQDHLFFAGPQRTRMVVASASDGKLQWTNPIGNLQLVLRDDGVWAAGPQKSENGMKLDYKTGEVLATFPARRACTRATGCADSVFYRASGGTVRVLTDTNTAQHIDPMRPPCQDGVLVAGGHLYWGPWMCGCQLSLYGNIALRPSVGNHEAVRPRLIQGDLKKSLQAPLLGRSDRVVYQRDSAGNEISKVAIPEAMKQNWITEASSGVLPTAPVVSGDGIFVADRSGAVTRFDRDGKTIWKRYTGGPIYYAPTVESGRLFVGSADGRVYAFAAEDGSLLWSFRVGPNERRILVYDRLVSAWPVAGGVVVQEGKVYAAAGIAHYDGTHVVSLNSETGELVASNETSGTLEEEVNNGVSMQGKLHIVDNELRFLAGGVYETARYDLESLRCLNTPKKQVNSQFRTAFYPYYPEYGKFVSLDYLCNDGCSLSHDASYEGSQFVNLARLPKLPDGAPKPFKEAARWVRRGGKMPKPIWSDSQSRRFTSFVVTDSTLLATGHVNPEGGDSFLVAIDSQDGTDRWIHSLPADAVKGGASIAHDGRVYVSLENGQLMCFTPD